MLVLHFADQELAQLADYRLSGLECPPGNSASTDRLMPDWYTPDQCGKVLRAAPDSLPNAAPLVTSSRMLSWR